MQQGCIPSLPTAFILIKTPSTWLVYVLDNIWQWFASLPEHLGSSMPGSSSLKSTTAYDNLRSPTWPSVDPILPELTWHDLNTIVCWRRNHGYLASQHIVDDVTVDVMYLNWIFQLLLVKSLYSYTSLIIDDVNLNWPIKINLSLTPAYQLTTLMKLYDVITYDVISF